MMEMPYLRTTSDDSSSETWYELANDAPGHHAVLYRTGIHAILTEISKKCYLGSGRFWVHLPGNVVENGVVSED